VLENDRSFVYRRGVAKIADLPPAKASEPRSRLLETASALFYNEGINNVGVDRIVSEASVTRATFYRHFPGKEALVLAYLQRSHDIIAERTEAALALEDPKERLLAIGEDLASQIRSKGFSGCAFIKAAAEFDDPEEPVRRAVAAHRAWFAGVIRKVFVDLGHSSPNDPMRHFVMLRDGAMVAGSLDGAKATTTTLLNGIDGLLRHLR
jgi:AcrR family transcriptional regulator